MRLCLLALSIATVAGCDSPAPFSEFSGVPPTRVEVGGSTLGPRRR